MFLRSLRLFKIVRVAIRYGLDEIAISGFDTPRITRLLNGIFF